MSAAGGWVASGGTPCDWNTSQGRTRAEGSQGLFVREGDATGRQRLLQKYLDDLRYTPAVALCEGLQHPTHRLVRPEGDDGVFVPVGCRLGAGIRLRFLLRHN